MKIEYKSKLSQILNYPATSQKLYWTIWESFVVIDSIFDSTAPYTRLILERG